jgi:hypothetical protein
LRAALNHAVRSSPLKLACSAMRTTICIASSQFMGIADH